MLTKALENLCICIVTVDTDWTSDKGRGHSGHEDSSRLKFQKTDHQTTWQNLSTFHNYLWIFFMYVLLHIVELQFGKKRSLLMRKVGFVETAQRTNYLNENQFPQTQTWLLFGCREYFVFGRYNGGFEVKKNRMLMVSPFKIGAALCAVHCTHTPLKLHSQNFTNTLIKLMSKLAQSLGNTTAVVRSMVRSFYLIYLFKDLIGYGDLMLEDASHWCLVSELMSASAIIYSFNHAKTLQCRYDFQVLQNNVDIHL